MPVRAQIFIPEAPYDLIIPVKPAYHEELLEKLRRLGQGIEQTFVDPAGDQVVPGSFRGTLCEERSLHLHETSLIEESSHKGSNSMPNLKGMQDLGPSQFKVAVFQSQGFRGIDGPVHLKRGCFGTVQDFEFLDPHFYITRGQIGILLAFQPAGNNSFYSQHPFVS